MKIAIVGCGAMGSIYAGLLASAGHEVIAVSTNQAHVQAINNEGLRISGASGDRQVPLRAFTAPPPVQVELLVLAVKATQIAAATDSVAELIGPETMVLTIQNGLGSAERVARVLDGDRLIVGIAQGFGASLPAAGHAHHNDMKAIRLGAYAELDQAKVEQIAALWRQAGFNATATANIVSMQWEKLICNVAYSAACAITGMTIGEAMHDRALGPVSRSAAVEAFDIAQALGVELEFSDPIRHVREFAARMPDAKPSVLLDLEAGRATEVDVINGAIPREASKVDQLAPINATLTALVNALAR